MKNRIIYIYLLIITLPFCIWGAYAQEQLTNLPTFYITTDDEGPITDKENYKKGKIIVKSSVASEELNIVTEIRGRGNSTWGMPKKPYRIKLDSKTRLLNLPAKARSWVLLANYADKTLIRNALAFKISELLEMEFSPSVRFVDVVLNGVYQGNYMLTDQVEVRNGRVPVEEQPGKNTTGGYLIELDGFAYNEPNWFLTSRGIPFTVKYPKDDEINTEQFNYIRTFTQNFENALFSSFDDPEKSYRAWVDEHSLINWYIICELTGNSDSFWSTYLYKYLDVNKFYVGPVWDFDIAFNNDNRLGDASRKLMRTNGHDYKNWIQRIWQDTWFRDAVHERWKELVEDKNIKEVLLDYIYSLESELEESRNLNFEKWKILNQRVYLETFLFPTYEEGIDFLAHYISERIDFLTENFAASSSEGKNPFDPKDNYFAITNVVNNKNITVLNNSSSSGANLVLWDADEKNESQQWKFVPVENDIYRIVNRKSSLVLSKPTSSSNLVQTTLNLNDKKQQWMLVPIQPSLYGIVNVASGNAIDNSGGGWANGNPIIEWNNQIENNQNQQWYLRAVAKTGIEDLFAENLLKIYPNPIRSNETLSIVLPENNTWTGSSICVEIYSSSGKSVYRSEQSFSRSAIEIRLENIVSGIYILRVGNYYAKLVVK